MAVGSVAGSSDRAVDRVVDGTPARQGPTPSYLHRLGSAFWWLGGVGVALTAALVFAVHHDQARRHILDGERRAADLLASSLSAKAPASGWHDAVAAHAAATPAELAALPVQAQWSQATRSVGQGQDLIRLQLRDGLSGRVLLSTDASRLGTAVRLPAPSEVTANVPIERVEAVVGLDGPLAARETVAILRPWPEDTAGAQGTRPRAWLEVTRDLTPQLSAQRSTGALLSMVVAGSLLSVLGVLGWLARRTARTLQDAEKERRKHESRLRHQAFHDVLTGLPNRTRFTERCNKLASDKRVKQLGVLFIDLDRFKLVNDSLGTKLGDAVLRQAAQRIVKSLRDTDTVFRVGGDEFIVLVDSDEMAVLDIAARRVITAMSRRFVVEQADVSLSVSIGMARWPTDAATLDEAAACAELATAAAKRAGLNQHAFYRREMKQALDDEVSMLAGLRNALERREFVLHYQPRLNSTTGDIESMEALLRWQHPTMGLLPPAKFIEILQDSPLIVDVGAWVIDTAAAQLALWHRQGHSTLGMSVNVAARQFRSKGFVKTVHRVLRDTGLPPQALELEITEGQLIHDLDAALETVQRLKALGVALSIDDFGTGYSSLAYLQRLPIDCIKIDRSFVQDLEQDPRHGKIARAITSMAHGLGLKVVAEGVETEAQAAMLRGWGCEQLQGFLFSRPVDAAGMDNLLDVQRADALRPPSVQGEWTGEPSELALTPVS